jgi:hypothetical protein
MIDMNLKKSDQFRELIGKENGIPNKKRIRKSSEINSGKS